MGGSVSYQVIPHPDNVIFRNLMAVKVGLDRVAAGRPHGYQPTEHPTDEIVNRNLFRLFETLTRKGAGKPASFAAVYHPTDQIVNQNLAAIMGAV